MCKNKTIVILGILVLIEQFLIMTMRVAINSGGNFGSRRKKY